MSISCFDDLIRAAHAQPDPQRLLFVFTRIDSPEETAPQQGLGPQHEAGGTLTPLACVDKTPDEVGTFRQFSQEAAQILSDWSFVFVGALGGKQPVAPTSEEAEMPLNQMIEMIKVGRVAGLNAFNRQGEAIMLHARTDYENFEPVLRSQPH